MTRHDVDVVVLGLGPGGEYAAQKLAEAGLDVVGVERDLVGGECPFYGCIPSKMYVVAADTAERARTASRLGVHAHVDHVDWPAIRDRIFGRIDPISAGGEAYRDEGCDNITLVRGTARFVGPDELAVGERRLQAPRILLAAGTRPVAPEIPGLAETGFHTSDDIMRLDRLPRRLLGRDRTLEKLQPFGYALLAVAELGQENQVLDVVGLGRDHALIGRARLVVVLRLHREAGDVAVDRRQFGRGRAARRQ